MRQITKTFKAFRYTLLTAIVLFGFLAIVGTGGGGGSSSRKYYYDGDGDGYGDPGVSSQNNSQPNGYVTDNTDCDDANANVHPGSVEVCGDGLDNDCDDSTDEECDNAPTTYYFDGDSDGYGNPDDPFEANSQPNGYVTDHTDCDDASANVHPGSAEVCGDGLDNDCDDATDEGCDNTPTTYYLDGDHDGYGNPGVSFEGNSPPNGYVTDNTDCDDAKSNINPGSVEVCGDGLDNDCDDATDEDCDDIPTTYYFDGDSDGYGNPDDPFEGDSQPNGYVADKTDCNDADASINPGAAEVCNDAIDNNCDGRIDDQCVECADADDDGYYDQNGCGTAVDCDDADASIHPDATEICRDSLDNDCDGRIDENCPAPTYSNSIGMTFSLIPAGTFMMGSPVDEIGRDEDETQHQVTLTRNFYMQTTEVTQEQWTALMESNPANDECGDNCPVESVTLDDVQEFIAELNTRGEGTYRLPTEAEWEYACRAGSADAFANGTITATYHESDRNLEAMGWYCFNSSYTTHPVARKQANAWGLYDMHGNVWEWCADLYGSYPTGSVVDPTGPSTGTNRVRRGGGWESTAQDCRSAERSDIHCPHYATLMFGFRLVREIR